MGPRWSQPTSSPVLPVPALRVLFFQEVKEQRLVPGGFDPAARRQGGGCGEGWMGLLCG